MNGNGFPSHDCKLVPIVHFQSLQQQLLQQHVEELKRTIASMSCKFDALLWEVEQQKKQQTQVQMLQPQQQRQHEDIDEI